VRLGGSGKAKGTSEGFTVNRSIVDRASETEAKEIMRREGGRAWASKGLIELERAGMEKVKGRTGDFGMWLREASKGIRSG
jgi:hypothetical protein